MATVVTLFFGRWQAALRPVYVPVGNALDRPPMSIKRTKQRNYGPRGREGDDEASPFGSKPAEPVKTWAELLEGKTDEQFAAYAMTARYDKGALILHSKFGKGVVVGVEGPRIEVLFEDGPKKLGHGQPA
jgi:hypothetical protein